MLEIGLGIGICFIMARIAGEDDESPVIWGAVTFLLCFASLSIPLPFARMLGAGFVAFVLMMIVKMIRR